MAGYRRGGGARGPGGWALAIALCGALALAGGAEAGRGASAGRTGGGAPAGAGAAALDWERWRAGLESALAARGFRGASLSVLVVERGSGALRFSRSPSRALVPASAQKLLVALAALDAFGPAHRFITRVRAPAPPDANGRVAALFVRGGGDASLTSEQWWRLAADLRALGVSHIEGDVLLDDSHFDGARWLPDWQPVSARAYHAPVGALSANYGAFRVVAAPGPAPGAPAVVRVDPPIPYLRVENAARTVRRGARSGVTVSRRAGVGFERVMVGGSVALGGEPRQVWRSVGNPLGYAGAVLRWQLEANGIRVAGRVRRGAAPAGAALLLDFEGFPLRRSVELALKYSNNMMTEALLKSLAVAAAPGEAAGAQGASGNARGAQGNWERGLRALRARLMALGVPLQGARLRDGSGLSRKNRVSAQTLVAVLRAADARFGIGPELLAALPMAASDGTLRERALAASQRLRAKTGSLEGVSALAGFARIAPAQSAGASESGGRDVVFAILANGFRNGDLEAARAMDRFAEALAGAR
ncbi:MAG: D-alanyl-D-alanine carboxypeptidase/D-alanyl-D-alanine-endopeptidase [Deltaproteobacteria bacterium]|nr:D-alanyl-D-alanine carboxypeptidase/D-alanyl-D-alanine-endopeptidase [Deltaproteobacteria bacterium]